jgi:hypothetical protein
MAYSGRYIPKNPSKYRGDPTKIIYRSLWERQVLKWLDTQDFIAEYSSEEVVIPYRCKTDNQIHRYFVDLWIKFKDGRIFLIEVKPEKETRPPVNPGRKTKRYITEVLTYAKNISKWAAADEYAKDRGWVFEVWHEKTLKSLGITLLTG